MNYSSYFFIADRTVEYMTNKTYDILKYVAQIVLPAGATLITTIANIWGLRYGENIALTIMAVDTFLGALLMLSSNNYNKKNKD